MARVRRRKLGTQQVTVDVLADEAAVGTARLTVTGYRDEIEAGTEWVEGPTEFAGSLSGIDTGGLMGKTLTLRFTDGREAEAFLSSSNGQVAFTSEPPISWD